MEKYRIVTDGIRYRLQIQVKRWYQQKAKWVFCGRNDFYCGFVITDYHSLKEAKKDLICAQIEDAAAKYGYQPI